MRVPAKGYVTVQGWLTRVDDRQGERGAVFGVAGAADLGCRGGLSSENNMSYVFIDSLSYKRPHGLQHVADGYVGVVATVRPALEKGYDPVKRRHGYREFRDKAGRL